MAKNVMCKKKTPTNCHFSFQGINFGTFTLHMSIGAVFVAFSAYGLLRFMYRKRELLVSEDSLEIRGNDQ